MDRTWHLGTLGWTGADFKGDNAPISLEGVSVSIGGQAAFVDYVSPKQVNAQLPSTIAAGGVLPLTVTSGNATSAAVNLAIRPTEPGYWRLLNSRSARISMLSPSSPTGITFSPLGPLPVSIRGRHTPARL